MRVLHFTQIDWQPFKASAAFCSSHLLDVDPNLLVVSFVLGQTALPLH